MGKSCCIKRLDSLFILSKRLQYICDDGVFKQAFPLADWYRQLWAESLGKKYNC